MALSIDDISDMWAVDGPIDRTKYSEENSNVAQLQNKYYRHLSIEKLRMKELVSRMKRLVKAKHEYYLGILDEDTLNTYKWKPFQLKVLRTDLPVYLEADEDIIHLSMKIENAKVKVEYLDSIVKLINFRSTQIKTSLIADKFANGLND